MKFLINYFWYLQKEIPHLKTLYIIKDQVQNMSTFPSSGTTMTNHASDLTIKITPKGLLAVNDVLGNSIVDFDFKENKIVKLG